MKQSTELINKFKQTDSFDNYIKIIMPALSKNEKFARNLVASFLLDKNPSIEELSDIKTAVSEAVTNSVLHGYSKMSGEISLEASIIGDCLYIKVVDNGVGISDIAQARQPFFTTGPEGERSGMGFTVMETFMDEVNVEHNTDGKGLVVEMVKVLKTCEQ